MLALQIERQNESPSPSPPQCDPYPPPHYPHAYHTPPKPNITKPPTAGPQIVTRHVMLTTTNDHSAPYNVACCLNLDGSGRRTLSRKTNEDTGSRTTADAGVAPAGPPTSARPRPRSTTERPPRPKEGGPSHTGPSHTGRVLSWPALSRCVAAFPAVLPQYCPAMSHCTAT